MPYKTFNNDPPFCQTHQKPMAISKFGGWYCTVKDNTTGQYCTERYKPYPKQDPKLNQVPQEKAKIIFAQEVFRRLDVLEEKIDTIKELLNKELT